MSIEQRIRSLDQSALQAINSLDLKVLKKISQRLRNRIKDKRRVYSTGIGSSEAHSKYLEVIFKRKIRHINPIDLQTLQDDDYLLIVFSQGLSPNMIYCLENIFPENVILITTVKNDTPNPKKVELLEEIEKNSQVLRYPSEIPDDTLIRITGPYIGYCIALLIKKVYENDDSNLNKQTLNQFNK